MVTVLPLELVFEAFHDLNFRAPGRQCHFRDARSVKVMRLEGTLGAHEIVVSIHPCVVGSVSRAIRAHDEDPRRRGMAGRVQHA